MATIFAIAILMSLSFASLPPVTRGCDGGWINVEDSCFTIKDMKLSQNMASLYCAFEDGNLASLSSVEKLMYLAKLVVIEQKEKFWVGLRQQGPLLMWNDNVRADFHPWVRTAGQAANCYVFNGAYVVSENCTEKAGFICERRKNRTNEETLYCPPGTVAALHMNKCFWTTHSQLTKDQAMAECSKDGGNMTDLYEFGKEDLKNYELENAGKLDLQQFWMQMLFNGHEGVRPSGDTIYLETPFPFVPGTGECMTFQFGSSFGFFLSQQECYSTAYAICEGTPDKIKFTGVTTTPTVLQLHLYQCPQGFNWKEDRKTGFCYWETSYETERLSWEEARRYCASYGGDLASFHSIEEERIGLSFQYGTLAHPYWIGLKYDVDTERFVWTDGSRLDYENWAYKQPNTKDLRMRCVQMDALSKKWKVSYCGILSWFVCKAPKQLNPKIPVLPTPVPLQNCHRDTSDYFLDGFCYKTVPLQYGWHRAENYCENKGSTLVSIHSETETNFLLRVMHANKALAGNRVWIGLNSLGMDGAYKWADGSSLDFTHWNENEPNNIRNQEKCCNMYIGNALWNDENCNALMGFVCKRKNDTSTEPTIRTTPSPLPGNCKKGWFAFQDNCYLPVGEKRKDWINWTDASERCHLHGGYLASVGNAKEQAFLSLLMQNLKSNTWIGLHDTIHSGVYFWLDNSPMDYTNWAPGEPSFFGLKEDCVLMVYNSLESGVWKDETCNTELPYICQTKKDPSIMEPWTRNSLRCVYAPDWLRQGDSCFQLFYNVTSNWQEAETTCQIYGGHLVSVTDFSIHAVIKYLAINTNTSFWIGLKAKSKNEFSWINNWLMTLSKWDNNEPGHIKDTTCYASSASGFWKSSPCSENKPFVCQTHIGMPPTLPKFGPCPSTAVWEDLGSRFCFRFEMMWKVEWYTANFRCFVQGGHLASIHSLEDMNKMRPFFRASISSVYIGLIRNQRGGFSWTDGTPVDFVNWDQGEPTNGASQCVEMKVETLKWNVISCDSLRYSVCGIQREIIPVAANGSSTSEKHTLAVGESHRSLSSGALAAIILCLLVIAAAGTAVFFYYRPLGKSPFRVLSQQNATMSFENALYNEDTAMEFRNDKSTVFIRN